ncbi:hypothetical protein GCM10010415_67290 [Streptomyces atrovirens]
MPYGGGDDADADQRVRENAGWWKVAALASPADARPAKKADGFGAAAGRWRR